MMIQNEDQMQALGKRLASKLQPRDVMHLQGPLGAGKTTLARAIIQEFGFSGFIKSPTYTLVEVYSLNGVEIVHSDFYRLNDPEELEAIGIRDYFHHQTIGLIEWPEKAQGYLIEPTFVVTIDIMPTKRSVHIQYQGADIAV